MQTSIAADLAGANWLELIEKAGLAAWLERADESERDWLRAIGFKAEPASYAFLPARAGAAPHVVAGAAAGEAIWKAAALPFVLPAGTYAIKEQGGAASREVALGWALGAYRFSRYKASPREPATLAWPASAADREEVERIASSVFLARDLINTPAADLGPAELAGSVAAVAARRGATCTVIAGAALDASYPAIAAVGRASPRAPRLIDLRWGADDAPRVTLVGKGVCFDTGGLDIKTHDGMLEMKKDMGGAAVMLALADALMSAQLNLRLRLLIPAVDNAISGDAMRPRDVLRMRGGKTVEIGNTDAEGRLLLADALSEAAGEAPELLIDCATLTGAAKVALGNELQALFCDDDEAAAELASISQRVGDPLWRLPIWRPYRRHLDSPVADLNNVAKGMFADAIVAALFLSEFAQGAKTWMHLDVFAANAAARPGRPEGGEATGMRALYAFLRARYAAGRTSKGPRPRRGSQGRAGGRRPVR
jgi:leucyl aminopeptidase